MKVGQEILLLFIIQEHFGHSQKVNLEDLTLQEIKTCLDFLINKSFFQVGSKILRQVIGIPMGSDPAPFFGNLFLFFYESKWLKSLKILFMGLQENLVIFLDLLMI